MKTKKNNYALIILLIISIIGGLICNYFYETSPKNAIRIGEFQEQLTQKENSAGKTLGDMKEIIIHSSKDSLINYSFTDNDISYYAFENNELIFWSDNSLDISSITLPDSTDWHYVQLPNAHCVSKLLTIDSYKFLALIKIKNNYTYENEELRNNFAKDFNVNKEVLIKNGAKTDRLAVFCSHNHYLFTLAEPQVPIYNETWSRLGLITYSLTFLLFFILFARSPYLFRRKTIPLKTFLYLVGAVGLFTGFCLFFNFPSLLFLNKLFSPFQYASNPFLASISHLTIATGFTISSIYLFYFHTNTDSIKNNKSHWAILTVFGLYFVLVYYVLSGLIYHSSFQLSILRFKDFSLISIGIHFLILIWGMGMGLLFFKTHNWFKLKKRLNEAIVIDLLFGVLLFAGCYLFYREDAIRIGLSYSSLCCMFYLPYMFPGTKKIYGYLVIWSLGFSCFFIVNSLTINNNKKIDKYKVLAQNISINGNTDNDRMADILLEELDVQIRRDKRIARLVAKTDSLSIANNYLNTTYLRGFWNKYEMRLNAATIHSTVYNEYNKFITNVGTQLKSTHFYSVPANENNMSYIGSFQIKPAGRDTIVFFMEFYPRRNFKSYSFPNLLIASAPDIQSKLNIGIAKYEHQRLVYSSGKFDYSPENNWIPKNKTDFYSIIYKGNIHYIYAPNATTYIVITEQQPYDPVSNMLYFIYTFLAFFAVCWIIIWSYQLTHRKRNYRLGLTAKFQYTFIGLLIISFLGIFYVSVNFIQQKYQEEQIANLESKKAYIQKALQDMYYWNQDLNLQNTKNLNFDLQDLSYIYHTDIHVYDNRGVLVGSSQPLIFNKNLISNRISPIPIFTGNTNMNQYEHIGKLNYLTGYSDFYNGDYLQIGYIAIPQFFSQDEIRSEIESFLTVIIHIYLIIIVLAILLSLFIGKQLSAPLNMLENKLKEMRLGRRNEKIEYSLNDEIGQLVIQYNRTVDELEQSARLLAKSERESAWKSMARQVAHEINNPLTPMKLSIQQLQRTKKMNDDRFDDYFDKSTIMLIEQIDNLSRIAGTFSNFARMPEANFERVDIAARLYSVVQLFVNNNEQVSIEFIGEEKNVFVYADPEQLVQVFNNLLKNALQAIPEEKEGKIDVTLKTENSRILIEISDNGSGIGNELHDKLFVPNFTTKNTGMGLGLAISKNIIELSGGTISFTSNLNEGTTFIVILPREPLQS
jgi:two-component system, NtrC family, nitrogen regulation sensor histidine kinase NtrY